MRVLLLSFAILLSTIITSAQQPTFTPPISYSSKSISMSIKPTITSYQFHSLSYISTPMQHAHYDSLYTFDTTNQISFKNVRTYNSQNMLTSDMIYRMINNSFVNEQKIDFVRDSSANLFQITTQMWENNLWDTYSRKSFYFDSLGRIIKMVHEGASGNGMLDSTNIIYRTYNTNGKISELSAIHCHNNQWFAASKSQVYYDALGRINCIIDSEIKNNQFTLSSIDSAYYNSNNDISKKIHFSYSNGYWKRYLEDTYTYNTAGVLTLKLETEYLWNCTNHLKSTYTYNSSGLILLINTEKLDNFNVWNNWKRESFSYNTLGQLTSRKLESFENNSWLNDNRSKFDFTYDANGNVASYTFTISQANSWLPLDKASYSYDNLNRSVTGESENYNNGVWIPSPSILTITDTTYLIEEIGAIRYLIFYPPNTASISSVTQSNNQIILYPNPAHDKFCIKMQNGALSHAQIEIFDISGKLLVDKKYELGNYIDISNFYKGIYIIRIKTDKVSQTFRLIKD